jgi:hypothetical protein
MTDPTGANTVRPLSPSVSCTEPGEFMEIGPADGRGERGGAALCGAAIPIGALPAESAPPQLQTTDATAAAQTRKRVIVVIRASIAECSTRFATVLWVHCRMLAWARAYLSQRPLLRRHGGDTGVEF